MIKIITVCGNGIGSSLMLSNAIKQLSKEWGVDISIKSSDLMTAKSDKADVFITAKRLANQLGDKNVLVIRSYTNKAKITEDIKDELIALANSN